MRIHANQRNPQTTFPALAGQAVLINEIRGQICLKNLYSSNKWPNFTLIRTYKCINTTVYGT